MPRKLKQHQRTPRQRTKRYAIVTAPQYADHDTLPTLKWADGSTLVLVRPLAFVLVDGQVVAIAPNAARAREWASDNLVVTRKSVTVRSH